MAWRHHRAATRWCFADAMILPKGGVGSCRVRRRGKDGRGGFGCRVMFESIDEQGPGPFAGRRLLGLGEATDAFTLFADACVTMIG